MEQAVSDLASSIAELQAEFQQVADVHPWVCLFFARGPDGQAVVGMPIGPPGFRELCPSPPPAAYPVLDRLNSLNDRADAVVRRVLEETSVLPPDLANEIVEWEKRCLGDGWVPCLRYAGIVRHVYWVENYAQVAANALGWLKEAVAREQTQATSRAAAQPRAEEGGRADAIMPRQVAYDAHGHPQLFKLGRWNFSEAGKVAYNGHAISLQGKPRRVLACLVRAKGKPVLDEAIAAAAGCAVGAVRVHLTKLRNLLRDLPVSDLPTDPIPYQDPDSYKLLLD
jgi:hypothetical protein